MNVIWSHWAHVMWSTRGQWLPGDSRGFRDHDHRVHSRGDYRNPPPPGEHAGLHKHAKSLLRTTVTLVPAHRAVVCEVLVAKLHDQGVAVRALCVCATHVHTLLRIGEADARGPVGVAKQVASRKLCGEIEGRMWGQRSHIVRIRDEGHYHAVTTYILRHSRSGACVWEPEKFRIARS